MPLNSGISTSAAAVSAMNQALFNAGPGNAQYLQQQQYVNQFGAFEFAKALVNQSFAGVANATLATQVLTNVGITRNTVSDVSFTALRDALVQFFDVYPNDKGVVILNVVDKLTGRGSALGSALESDATFGAVAINFNNNVNNRFAYSSNSANTVPQVGGSTENSVSQFTLSGPTADVAEGANAAFQLTVSSNVAVDTIFNYALTGTTRGGTVAAGSAADVSPATGSVTIKAGTNSVSFQVGVLADGVAEPVEGMQLSLTNAQNTLVASGVFNIAASVATSLQQDVSSTVKGPFNASTSDVTFNFATGEYASQINGYGRGDVLNFFPNEVANLSLLNTSSTDGQLAITATSASGQQVVVTLTGLAQADDAAVFGVNSFRTVFGANSLQA